MIEEQPTEEEHKLTTGAPNSHRATFGAEMALNPMAELSRLHHLHNKSENIPPRNTNFSTRLSDLSNHNTVIAANEPTTHSRKNGGDGSSSSKKSSSIVIATNRMPSISYLNSSIKEEDNKLSPVSPIPAAPSFHAEKYLCDMKEVLSGAETAVDDATVVWEGGLCKYKPQLRDKKIERWCQATLKEFRYFKDNWNAHCWLTRPIFTLPLHKVARV